MRREMGWLSTSATSTQGLVRLGPQGNTSVPSATGPLWILGTEYSTLGSTDLEAGEGDLNPQVLRI